jgi:hypothetical protein
MPPVHRRRTRQRPRTRVLRAHTPDPRAHQQPILRRCRRRSRPTRDPLLSVGHPQWQCCRPRERSSHGQPATAFASSTKAVLTSPGPDARRCWRLPLAALPWPHRRLRCPRGGRSCLGSYLNAFESGRPAPDSGMACSAIARDNRPGTPNPVLRSGRCVCTTAGQVRLHCRPLWRSGVLPKHGVSICRDSWFECLRAQGAVPSKRRRRHGSRRGGTSIAAA